MKLLVTGGAGFIGSHLIEFFINQGNEVIAFDNLSRLRLMGENKTRINCNLDFLKRFNNVNIINGDITNMGQLEQATKDVDVIIHTAAQTSMICSIKNPETDFKVNALGTFNVLEAGRKNDIKKIIFCSTNKVYGDKVNKIATIEKKERYSLSGEFKKGIPENFGIDMSRLAPYGCSKLTGELYTQNYSSLYGINTGIFRMSCIYGPRQIGFDKQGWISWFIIANILEKQLTIYGDGKQVRDILYVTDIIKAFDKFITRNIKLGVYNIGGGPKNTISLLEFITLLEKLTGKKSKE